MDSRAGESEVVAGREAELLATVPVPAFVERPPWIGGDLQMIRNAVVRRRPPLLFRDGLPRGSRREVAAPDGSGDRLQFMLHRSAHARFRPLVVLQHGLTGCEDSAYMRTTASLLLAHGWPVARVNLRGAGPSRATCTRRYHAGSSDDLAAVLDALAPEAPAGMVAVGFSLGGSILLKHLIEAGPRTRLQAAMTVSAPIDLAAASRRLQAPRNRSYARWLLLRMKAEAMAPGTALTLRERRLVAAAASMRELDDTFVAPRNGFRTGAEYRAHCSAAARLAAIRIPVWLIHAGNDPWIPMASYRSVDWSAYPLLRPLLTDGGGHVGFHGIGSRIAWHDRCLLVMLAALEQAGLEAGAAEAMRRGAA